MSQRFSRRAFLCFSAATTTLTALDGWANTPSAATDNIEALKRAWVKDAMTDRAWNGPPILSQFNDGMYFLQAPLAWKPEDARSRLPNVHIPAGFVTDLASVPRPFWQFLPRDGRYSPAAIVHDYLYWTQSVPKKVADDIFRLAMQELDVSSITVDLIYAGIRSPFGDSAWNHNAALKESGEQRIMSVFPKSPAIKWSNWKLTKGNFDTSSKSVK